MMCRVLARNPAGFCSAEPKTCVLESKQPFSMPLRLAPAPPRTANRLRLQTVMAVAVLALCSAAHAQVPADAPAPERAATGQARADDIRALDQQVQTVLAEARRQGA